jgi:hypothetical protein
MSRQIKAELVLRRRVFCWQVQVGRAIEREWSLPFGPSSGEVSVATAFCFAMQTSVKSRWTVRGFSLGLDRRLAATSESEAKKGEAMELEMVWSREGRSWGEARHSGVMGCLVESRIPPAERATVNGQKPGLGNSRRKAARDSAAFSIRSTFHAVL